MFASSVSGSLWGWKHAWIWLVRCVQAGFWLAASLQHVVCWLKAKKMVSHKVKIYCTRALCLTIKPEGIQISLKPLWYIASVQEQVRKPLLLLLKNILVLGTDMKIYEITLGPYWQSDSPLLFLLVICICIHYWCTWICENWYYLVLVKNWRKLLLAAFCYPNKIVLQLGLENEKILGTKCGRAN